VSGPSRVLEQIAVKPARTATAARRCRDHDAVDIDKARIVGAEPLEIRAVVIGVLIQRQQKRVDISDSSRHERLCDEMFQPLRRQPRQFPRVRVVECEQRLAQRLAA